MLKFLLFCKCWTYHRACSIELTTENKTSFSGDIGRDNDVLMYPPTKPKKADYVSGEYLWRSCILKVTQVRIRNVY
jgi:metallo-beta-lactamase family protein